MNPAAAIPVALVLLGAAAQAGAAQAQRESFGVLEGQPVEAVVLSNAKGMKARIIAYGAALQQLLVPGRHGQLDDVVLSYPRLEDFRAHPQYFGATIGRFANRIAHGSFVLDGTRYQVPRNDGANSLHGGARGFDKALWRISAVHGGPVAGVTLTLVSPDGDQGYPGELTASVTYELTDADTLTLRYRATTTKPTVVNLTNHSYFNLSGAASGRDVLNERLRIPASAYTPVDAGLIPTGERRSVAGTAFDFTSAHAIGERLRQGQDEQLLRARGYDHNFILDKGPTPRPELAAQLSDPDSGRVLQILTTEAALQFYSGNFLDATSVGKDGVIYRQSVGLCLEPQRFPDAPNQPGFPSARLDPGQVYEQVSVYRFTVEE